MKDYMKEFELLSNFETEGEIKKIQPFGEGHINSTFLITTDIKKYTLQKINTNVFKNPKEVMENIFHVTEFLRKKGETTLNVVKTKSGELFMMYDNEAYRLYEFIDDVMSYQIVEDNETFCNVGEGFGHFQKCLSDFDASVLHETIARFHDTPKRFRDFEEAVKNNKSGRLSECADEVKFITDRKDTYDKVIKGIESGEIPLRVTHNDTKLNNILMDPETKKAKAIIDLDTVMPGSLLYDYGDSMRFGTNTGAEDEQNLDLVHFDIELFRAYTKGFCKEMASDMTKLEIELLPYSAYLMTIECGMRFLADFIDGDTYFATKYPEHNLVRCRTQLKLASEMEKAMKEMKAIVNEYI